MGASPLGCSSGIAIVEKAYQLEGDTVSWLTQVAEAAAPDLNRDVGVIAYTADPDTMIARAASGAGITLIPVSGFRSVARQGEIIREKLARGLNLPDILRLVAAPGYSEHHTGRAIDITAPDDPPLEAGFAQTPAFKWLQAHARDFGFTLSFPPGNLHGIAYEPWHWLWQPRPAAGNPT